MDVLDSPIDALAFDYVNLGILAIINNLWTWVAVITAAVSFWRIRAAGAVKTLAEPSPSPDYIERQITESSHPETSSSSSSTTTTTSTSSSTATTATPKSVTEPAAPGSVSSSPSVFEDNGPKKGKFVVYYQDDDRQNEGNLDDDDEDGEEELTVLGEWRRCGGEITLWERMLRVSMGEYGWYRCQDLTVINGNVVRLWDGVRREKKSSGSVAW